MSESESPGEDRSPIAALREAVAGFLPKAREESRTLLERLALLTDTGAMTPEATTALREAAGVAHKLAGAAGSMGFPAVGRLAAALEMLLEGVLDRDRPPSPAVRTQLDHLAHRLRDRMAVLSEEHSTLFSRHGGPPAASSPDHALRESARRLLLIGSLPGDPAAALADRLAWFGWQVDTLPDALAAEDRATTPGTRPPGLILVDLETVPDAIGHVSRLTGARGSWPGVPWFCAETQPSARTRATAAAAGSAGVLSKPVRAEALVDLNAAVITAAREETPRVLVIDPEPAVAAMLRHVLDGAGAMASVVAGPDALVQEAFDSEDDGGVDAIVMVERANAPGAVDLAVALRQDPAFDIPGLVLVVPSPDLDPLAGALARGGDVVMPAPIEPDLFVATVLGQAVRARGRRDRGRREGNGPVLVRAEVDRRLEHLRRRAAALDLPLAVAWISAEDTPEGDPVAAAARDPALTRLLATVLRPSDLIGRGPDDGLVAVLPFLTETEARALLAPLEPAMAHLVPGCRVRLGLTRAGAGSGGDDPESAADLWHRARAAADEARPSG